MEVVDLQHVLVDGHEIGFSSASLSISDGGPFGWEVEIWDVFVSSDATMWTGLDSILGSVNLELTTVDDRKLTGSAQRKDGNPGSRPLPAAIVSATSGSFRFVGSTDLKQL